MLSGPSGKKGKEKRKPVKYPLTSRIQWVATELKTHNWPFPSTAEITMFGTICPATKLTLEASGGLAVHGYAVRKPGSTGSTTVAFKTTAVASGMSVPKSTNHTSAGKRSFDSSRVSTHRTGVVEMNPDVEDEEYHPARSAMRSRRDDVKKHTRLSAGNATVTRFGTVCPPVTLRFEARGRPPPHGNAVTNPLPSTSVAVRFNTADVASVATYGVRSNAKVAPVASLLVLRVSNMRTGTLLGTKPSPPPIT